MLSPIFASCFSLILTLVVPIPNSEFVFIHFSLLWTFSTIATSADSLSFKSITTAGTFVNPAMKEALYLLSPAIISYLFPTFLNTSGWIIPCCLIDLASSFNSSSSKESLGWNLFGIISSKATSIISFSNPFIIYLSLFLFIILQ